MIFFLEILDDQEVDICIRTNGFLITSSYTSVKFMIQALMEEINPVAAEKKSLNIETYQ